LLELVKAQDYIKYNPQSLLLITAHRAHFKAYLGGILDAT